ncbi:MAG TPA: 4Fe-4S dicluster domain-containing protein [Bacteroidaceae bacterium]|nr:4Fe-4S dicluster domain-containing protein [Bacteroidaceae bacterium]
MLRKVRITISIAAFLLLTYGFIDFTGVVNSCWIQKIQFGPSLFALSLISLLSIIVITLIFGRIYCSTLCPLGFFQDIFNWLAKKINRKKKYGYKRETKLLRWGILAILVIAWLTGLTIMVGLFEPYSAYGRIAYNIFRPIFIAGNNILAGIAEKVGIYSFYYISISIRSVAALIISTLTFVVIGFFSYKFGRSWCNIVCPVGTILGFFSKWSLFKIKIDTDKCNQCKLCNKNCKAYCIDVNNQCIDYSRCIGCFSCIDICNKNAITYSFSLKNRYKNRDFNSENKIDLSKRSFLKSALATASLLPASIESKATKMVNIKAAPALVPISPPGSISHNNMHKHCTSCHLCVSKCPSNVLVPALLEYGIGGFMQPVMKFDKGYCNYNCTICSQACPNGAIKPLSIENKHRTQPGFVIFEPDLCVVYVNETSCGACAEHCPTQAVKMIPWKGALTVPSINREICVGCGGCEFICPAHAIYVNGNAIHVEAKIEEQEAQEVLDDFGFGF